MSSVVYGLGLTLVIKGRRYFCAFLILTSSAMGDTLLMDTSP